MVGKVLIVIATVAVLGIGYVNLVDSDSDSTTAPGATTGVPEVAAEELPIYALADVAERNTREDCWTIIDGFVYDITEFVNRHPGGVDNILQACGTDRTAQFETPSGPHNQSSLQSVQQYRIGRLQ
jgi:cytochrome b involved in lipid metabolism